MSDWLERWRRLSVAMAFAPFDWKWGDVTSLHPSAAWYWAIGPFRIGARGPEKRIELT